MSIGLMTGALRSLAAVFLISGMGIVMFQDRLLYFPDQARLAEMLGDELAPWPSASDFRGLVAEPAEPARATAIVFHGNAGHAGHRRFYIRALARQGLRVILAEYPGYGPRNGELGEKSLVNDAEKTLSRAYARYGAPLVIIGESLGAGVAAAASARRQAETTGLLLLTPWDKLERVASYHYPFLPVSLLLHDRYDSVAHLKSYRKPVLVALASDDRIIPSSFGQALYDALDSPKRLSIIADAGHNDWFDRLDEPWWRNAIDFLLAAAKP